MSSYNYIGEWEERMLAETTLLPVRLINGTDKRTVAVSEDFPYLSLATGDCRGCAGSGEREFTWNGSRQCRDCLGTGRAHIHENSVAGRTALREHES